MRVQKYSVMGDSVGIWGHYYLRTYAKHKNCRVAALIDQVCDYRQAFTVQLSDEVIDV